ncbi:MAG: DNA polymerase IV [Acidimicrobiales bacterium]
MTDAGVRTILHVDMDAFYVSVELVRRPELRGRPVVVGGTGSRGVVAAASYEARAHGVFSAMPSVRAARLCPEAVFLSGDHATYAEVSRRVMAIFESFTPLVEPLSLDEAFLDVSGVRRLHGDGPTIAQAIRDQVAETEQLTCSVGVAPSKFLAKLASQAAKPLARPDGPRPGPGVVVVEPGQETAFLHPLSVSALWGVGPATLERLTRLGVRTVGDLASMSLEAVVSSLGVGVGAHLHRLANGIDDRPVTPNAPPKSVSHEETYAVDVRTPDELEREIVRQADAVAGRLRRQGLAARTITLKVRFHDFRTITRSVTLDAPVDSGPHLARPAKRLLAEIDVAGGVRLLGVAASNLDAGGPRQLSFDDEGVSWDDASQAVDRIRERFGDRSIGPAVTVGPDGVRLTRRGAQQWGPDAVDP